MICNGSFRKSEYDILVVGARCAGAATAMLLARSGARVLVVDRDAYGSETQSTHAMMRGGAMLLRRWGLLDRVFASGAQPVTRTVFTYEGEPTVIDMKPSDGIEALCAPRRQLLDRILVDAAREAGAEVRHGVRVGELLTDRWTRVTGAVLQGPEGETEAVTAGLVIGADGRRSTVAQAVGAPTYRPGRHLSATVYGYFDGLENQGYNWSFGGGFSAGAIPTDGGLSCVFVQFPPRRFRELFPDGLGNGFEALLRRVDPALAARVAAASMVGRWHRFGGAPGHLRQASGNGWALVGDAGYFKDPITAHGITDAFRDAELLSGAILKGGAFGLAGYQTTRDLLSMDFFDATDRIASFEWDLEEVQRLHRRLSDAMQIECRHIRDGAAGLRSAA